MKRPQYRWQHKARLRMSGCDAKLAAVGTGEVACQAPDVLAAAEDFLCFPQHRLAGGGQAHELLAAALEQVDAQFLLQ